MDGNTIGGIGLLGFDDSPLPANSTLRRVGNTLVYRDSTGTDHVFPEVQASAWTPTLYIDGVAHGAYLERQGYYKRCGNVITATCWVRTNGNIAPTADSLAIGDLPFEGDMSTTLAFWPALVGQASVIAGGAFGRLQPAVSPRIFINDVATQLGNTLWTFTAQFFVNINAEYLIAP
jgi:hypothetical protein